MTSHMRSARIAFVHRAGKRGNSNTLESTNRRNEFTAMANNPASLYEQLTATAEDFIKSYDNTFKTKDTSLLSSTLTADCVRHFAPSSLFSVLPRLQSGLTISQYEDNEAEIFRTYDVCENSIIDMIVDEKANKVVIQTQHHIELKGRVFDFEHMITLRMNEDGTKIKDVQHFVDSLGAARFLDGSQAGKNMREKPTN